MDLINFLHPKLYPGVYCDAVSAEGYSVDSLIRLPIEQQGFVGFQGTNPPVEIIFKFPKKVKVFEIKLWNSLGELRSTAFEIQSKYNGVWERVAHVNNLHETNSVTFRHNRVAKSRNKYDSFGEQSEEVHFFKTALRILSDTNSIKIVIKSTVKCPPVLKKVQIWGLPSRSVAPADCKWITTTWNKIITPEEKHSILLRSQQHDLQPSIIPELVKNSELTIPEEFLDAVTWELMIFPMVLPSGKIVDQSTLDKHAKEERAWGRSPSDPFTGVIFTDQRKPIINLPLKARIEKFIMENSEHFKTVPRCLGSIYNKRTHSLLPSNSFRINTAELFKTGEFEQEKLKLFKRVAQTKPNYLDDFISASKRFKTNAIQNSTVTSTLASSSDHQASRDIQYDLDAALQRITRYTQCMKQMEELTSCIGCKSTEYTYWIKTCEHVVCRECLVQLTKDKMCKCKMAFVTADVERYHKI